MGIAVLTAALAFATSQQFLVAHQSADGGFAEAGGKPDAALTAWSLLALRSANAEADDRYLREHESDLRSPTEIALGVLAEVHPSDALLTRLAAVPDTSAVNVTAWKVLGLAGARRPVPRAALDFLLGAQTRSGGWSWARGIPPDSNDTAAVIEALRSADFGGRPIRRGLVYLRRLENRDGGFALTRGRSSDAQSTAWAIQAFVAAESKPPLAAFRYLALLRRPDGSYRYSLQYAITPVWVTAQVLPALERRAFPLR